MLSELFGIDSTIMLLVERLAHSMWRYLFFAGIPFAFFYLWKTNPLRRFRIQKRPPQRKHIVHEVKWSMMTRVMFGLISFGVVFAANSGDNNYTQLYLDIGDYGWAYFIGSIIVLILLHDTYFYWMHRLIHHKKIYKYVHRVHHKSTNPTPLASFSFHPLETILEALIFPILIFVVPLHPIALLSVFTFSIIFNVYGHSGFEFFPRGWVHHPILKYINTPTHHNQHHGKFKYNYGLYFNWWDRWMGTQYAQYEQVFDAIKARPKPVKETAVLRADGVRATS